MSLAIRDLTVQLGKRTIVSGVSFAAARGSLTFMVGPNGAGKTTALRAIAGLLGAKGTIVIDGRDVTDVPAHKRGRLIAYVPQGHVAHWPLSARDVVAIGRRPHGSSLAAAQASDHAAIERALAAVDATNLAERVVTDLSGGERARVMLARALAAETQVILADEPIAALDPHHQLAVAALLKRLAGEGRTILAVVHDLALAARFADNIVVMADGRLAATGRPAEVLTDTLLAQVFAITAARFEHRGAPGFTPWDVVAEDPAN